MLEVRVCSIHISSVGVFFPNTMNFCTKYRCPCLPMNRFNLFFSSYSFTNYRKYKYILPSYASHIHSLSTLHNISKSYKSNKQDESVSLFFFTATTISNTFYERMYTFNAVRHIILMSHVSQIHYFITINDS